MARQVGTGVDENRLGAPPDINRIVRHQTMPPHDQIQRALALADTALAGDQDTESENVHEHRVDDDALRETVFEDRAELRDGGRRRDGGLQQRPLGALGLEYQIPWGDEATGDQDAGKVVRERQPHRVAGNGRLEALEITDLALSENQHAARPEVLVE